MKKLIITLATVAMAAYVQAASVTWGSGSFTGPNGETLKGTSSGKNVWGYLFEMSATDYATYSADLSKVYTDFKAGTLTADASGKWASAASSIDLEGKSTYADGATVYGAVLYGFFNAGEAGADAIDKATHYIVTMGSATAADLGGSLGNLATSAPVGGATTGWTAAAVPEPTSGILMLLGVAGLALRRRRA